MLKDNTDSITLSNCTYIVQLLYLYIYFSICLSMPMAFCLAIYHNIQPGFHGYQIVMVWCHGMVWYVSITALSYGQS